MLYWESTDRELTERMNADTRMEIGAGAHFLVIIALRALRWRTLACPPPRWIFVGLIPSFSQAFPPLSPSEVVAEAPTIPWNRHNLSPCLPSSHSERTVARSLRSR